MISGGVLASNVSLSYGLDDEKPESPKAGAIYVATDTSITYVCFENGTWENAAPKLMFSDTNSMSDGVLYGPFDTPTFVFACVDASFDVTSQTAITYNDGSDHTVTRANASGVWSSVSCIVPANCMFKAQKLQGNGGLYAYYQRVVV